MMGLIGIVFSLVYVSLKEFGVVGSDTYTWGIKDFHKCWSGSLAKRRLCLGPASVINCTPLSALSFSVSLFPGTCGYNTMLYSTVVLSTASVFQTLFYCLVVEQSWTSFLIYQCLSVCINKMELISPSVAMRIQWNIACKRLRIVLGS